MTFNEEIATEVENVLTLQDHVQFKLVAHKIAPHHLDNLLEDCLTDALDAKAFAGVECHQVCYLGEL